MADQNRPRVAIVGAGFGGLWAARNLARAPVEVLLVLINWAWDYLFYERAVRLILRSVPGVSGIHELRAEYIGPETVRAGMHIEVEPGLSIVEADRIAEEVRQRVHRDTGSRYCVIHVDPAEAREPAAGEGDDGAAGRVKAACGRQGGGPVLSRRLEEGILARYNRGGVPCRPDRSS